jgi:hypothetical protein
MTTMVADMGPGAAVSELRLAGGEIVVGHSVGTPSVDPGPFDVLLTDTADPPLPWVNATPGDLVARVEDSTEASVALVHVLRSTEQLGVAEALSVESMAYSMLQGGERFQRWRREQPKREQVDEGTGDPVLLERHGNTLEVVLNRPAVRNAFNAAMRDALIDAFDLVDLAGDIEEVHLRGSGTNFCSGGDLDEFGTAGDPAAAHLLRVDRYAGRRIHDHAAMVTAHVHGSCVGAGVELPAFAGRVVAAPDATFRLPEVSMGLVPGAGGTVSVPRRTGRHRAAWMALSGARVDARTALAWGLVDTVG